MGEIKSFKEWKDEQDDLNEIEVNTEYYDVSYIGEDSSGLEFPVWIAVGKTRKPKLYIKDHGKMLGISVANPPLNIDKKLLKFIEVNRKVLTDYWYGDISTKGFADTYTKVH